MRQRKREETMARSKNDIAARLSDQERVAWRALQTIPNIGPAIGYDLIRLGIRSPEDLVGKDPDELYAGLGRMDGAQHDPCLLDTLVAAVSYAETGEATPWWHFTPMRKALEGT
jgi:hypothetical protein